jgi:predicted nucleotidyltransferase
MADRQVAAYPDLEAVGVFGSYGRGDAGVGSDMNLLLILHSCDLPVWERLRRWNPAFAAVLARDLRWLASRDCGS